MCFSTIGRPTRDYVDQLVAPHVDNRGAPLLVPELPAPPEQRLIHAHSLDVAYPVGVGLEECFTPAVDLVVDRVPGGKAGPTLAEIRQTLVG